MKPATLLPLLLLVLLPAVAALAAKPANPDAVSDFTGTISGSVAEVHGGGNWVAVKVDSTQPDVAVAGQTLGVSLDWGSGKAAQQAYFKSLKAGDPVTMKVTPSKGNILRLVEVPGGAPTAAQAPAAKQGPSFAGVTYGGREPDAPWRAEAQKRIEQHRMAPLTVKVVDAAGNPVPGAEVTFELTRHQFHFGNQARDALLIGQPGEKIGKAGEAPDMAGIEKYRQMLSTLFNKTGYVNLLKADWRSMSEQERQDTIAGIQWAKSQGMVFKGHTLVWPDWGHSSWAAKKFGKDAKAQGKQQAFQAEQLDRLREKAQALRGLVDEWDVINEMKNNMYSDSSFFANIGGLDAAEQWLREARAVLPDTRLFVTDNTILDSRTNEEAWWNSTGKPVHEAVKDNVYAYLKELIDRGAPFDVIGMQGHFKPDKGDAGMAVYTAIPELFNRLERFAALGKDIEVTELDMVLPDGAENDPDLLQFQADYLRDFLTILYSHPSVTGVTFWGMWEDGMRFKDAALFLSDWTPKPNGQAFLDLVHGQWKTRAGGATDAAGSFVAPGHLGTYNVTVRAGERTATQEAQLQKGGSTVRVVLQ